MKATVIAGALMGLLAFICCTILMVGLHRVIKKTDWPKSKKRSVFVIPALLIALWFVLTGVLAKQGFFAHFNTLPPRPVLVILLPLPFVIMLAFSRGFKKLLLLTPPHWLLFFQSFRIVVELLLWRAFIVGLLPVQMTFEGRNFDILAGVLGLIAGWWMLHKKKGYKKVAIAYNIVGLALLLNILIIALLSMPTPARYFLNEPSAAVVAQFPFIYLPGILVVLAYSFHLFSLRQLLLKKEAITTSSSFNTTNFSKQHIL